MFGSLSSDAHEDVLYKTHENTGGQGVRPEHGLGGLFFFFITLKPRVE